MARSSASRVSRDSRSAPSGMTAAIASRARSAAWRRGLAHLDHCRDQGRAGLAAQPGRFAFGGADCRGQRGKLRFCAADALVDGRQQCGEPVLLRIDALAARRDPFARFDRGLAHPRNLGPRRFGSSQAIGRRRSRLRPKPRPVPRALRPTMSRCPGEGPRSGSQALRPQYRPHPTAEPAPPARHAVRARAPIIAVARASPALASTANRSSSAARPISRSAIIRCDARSCSATRAVSVSSEVPAPASRDPSSPAASMPARPIPAEACSTSAVTAAACVSIPDRISSSA